jgi:hypothetical protein
MERLPETMIYSSERELEQVENRAKLRRFVRKGKNGTKCRLRIFTIAAPLASEYDPFQDRHLEFPLVHCDLGEPIGPPFTPHSAALLLLKKKRVLSHLYNPLPPFARFYTARRTAMTSIIPPPFGSKACIAPSLAGAVSAVCVVLKECLSGRHCFSSAVGQSVFLKHQPDILQTRTRNCSG